jgi:hypothetical protein
MLPGVKHPRYPLGITGGKRKTREGILENEMLA